MERSLRLIVLLLLAVSAAASDPVTLTVEVLQPTTSKDNRLFLRFLTVRFTNTGRRTLFILRPLDGSFDGVLAPFYRFTIRDASAEPVRLGAMDNINGLWSETSWPDDYLIALLAHHAHETPVLISFALGFKIPIKGTIDFEYSMPVDPPPTKGRTNPEIDLTYPQTVWRGTATAKRVIFDSSAQPK